MLYPCYNRFFLPFISLYMIIVKKIRLVYHNLAILKCKNHIKMSKKDLPLIGGQNNIAKSLETKRCTNISPNGYLAMTI